MSVLSIYAPTNPPNSTFESAGPSDAFYDQLQLILSSVPSSDLLVIMCDFMLEWVLTAPLGTQSWVLTHCIGECIENGEQLLDICASNHILISNTWFQHKLAHQATWF